MSDSKMRRALEEMIEEAVKATDDEVLADWKLAGERMLAERPSEFQERYRFLLSAFADKPELEPTLQNWIRLGAKLIAEPRSRRAMIKISITTNLMFDQQDAERKLS